MFPSLETLTGLKRLRRMFASGRHQHVVRGIHLVATRPGAPLAPRPVGSPGVALGGGTQLVDQDATRRWYHSSLMCYRFSDVRCVGQKGLHESKQSLWGFLPERSDARVTATVTRFLVFRRRTLRVSPTLSSCAPLCGWCLRARFALFFLFFIACVDHVRWKFR